MRSEDYLNVIGCGSREGRGWKGDIDVVRQAVDRKLPPLQDRQETVRPLSTTGLLTAANAKLQIHTEES